MDINQIVQNLKNFYTSICKKTGLESWQLLVVALAIIFIFSRIIYYIQKARIKMRLARGPKRSKLIGTRLGKKQHKQIKKKQPVDMPEEEEHETQPWGQTTKEWRKLREKVRHLQHDISKYEKIEKQLKEEIAALKTTNEKLQLEIDKRAHAEQTTTENENNKESIEQSQAEQNPNNKEIVNDFLLSQSSEKPYTSLENTLEEDFNQSDTKENNNNLPLDTKELTAIADLVKRLQLRSQERQGD